METTSNNNDIHRTNLDLKRKINPDLSDTDIYYIMLNLDLKSLFSFCQSYKFAYNTCYSYSFWQDKIINDFGNKYINVYYDNDYWEMDYDDPLNLYLNAMYSYISNSIKNEDIKSIEYTIRKGFENWCLALYEAGELGNENIINYFIDKANINNKSILYCVSLGAAKSGNTQLLSRYMHFDVSSTEWQDLLIESMKSRKNSTFRVILSNMLEINVDCKYLLWGVSAYGTPSMFLDLLKNTRDIKGSNCLHIKFDVNYLIETTIYYGNMEMFDEFMENWAHKEEKEDITKYILMAIDERNYDSFEHIFLNYENFDISKTKHYIESLNGEDLDKFKEFISSFN